MSIGRQSEVCDGPDTSSGQISPTTWRHSLKKLIFLRELRPPPLNLIFGQSRRRGTHNLRRRRHIPSRLAKPYAIRVSGP
jgi:hypothetical protein